MAVAGSAPLSPDEAYYWVWSKALAPAYLDHPGMVALFIRVGTALAGDGAVGIRLLAPVAAAVGSLLLARAGEDFFPGRGVGFWAAGFLNATLAMGTGSVTMTPDTPLLLFWTAAVCAAGRLIATGQPAWWLAIGLAGGLALDSKYSAALLVPALLAWLLLRPAARPWLATRWPYLGGAVALAVFAPVLLWNAAHGWAGFMKQGGRIGEFSSGRAFGFEAELLAGQVGLATPGLAVLFAAGLASAWRGGTAASLLAYAALVPLAVFVEHALGDRVQANWPAIVFPAAAIAAAGLGDQWRGWYRPSVALGLVVTACVYVQSVGAPLPLPPQLDPTLTRLGGWDDLARGLAMRASLDKAAYIVADDYGLASLLAWSGMSVPVVGIERRWAFLRPSDATAALSAGSGLLIRSARRTDEPGAPDWAVVSPAGSLARTRAGLVAENYSLFRVHAGAAGQPCGTTSWLLPTSAGGSDASAESR